MGRWKMSKDTGHMLSKTRRGGERMRETDRKRGGMWDGERERGGGSRGKVGSYLFSYPKAMTKTPKRHKM